LVDIVIIIALSIGIIPGPHEPPEHINTFLEPLVDDLLDLWDGVPLNCEGTQTLRAALGSNS
jgi:hypothetical protein